MNAHGAHPAGPAMISAEAPGAPERTGNLPAEVTRFVGRRRELAEVRLGLARSRLVTLCGVAGVGKTRLALRAAAAARRSFADGVWLVELSALREPQLLARSVAEALGLPDLAAGDPVDLLAKHLADRQLLVVLDTCEHLIEPCAMLAEVLLQAAPKLWILTTSREPLEVMGEHTLLVPPLETPRPDGPDGPVADCDSMTLFADRAEAITPGFRITAANQRAVARLCRGLDGIPLAIELAAVRLRAMSVDQIVARLDDRFRVLGTARTNQGRHQTLRAAIEWSHELCTAQERLLWARLSVFPGDFDLEAAERICAGNSLAPKNVFDTLGRLVEKSIVLYERDRNRYRMLDTIRQYGDEQLGLLGERDGVGRRHRDHYLALAERSAAAGFEQVDWLVRLRQETPNLRVALDHSYASPGQEVIALRMTVSLRHYWAVYGAGVLAVKQGDIEAAKPLLAWAGELEEGLHDQDLEAHVTDAQGFALFFAGELEEAAVHYEKALALYAQIGYSDSFALACYTRLASVCCLTGEYDRAINLSEESLRISEARGDQWGRGFALWVRGAARWLAGDLRHAVDDALASLRIKESLGDLHGITIAIDLLAVCLMTQADFGRAAVLCGVGDSLWKTLHAPIQQGPHYAEIRRHAAETIRRELGDDRFHAAHRQGTQLSLPEAINLARAGHPSPPDDATTAGPAVST